MTHYYCRGQVRGACGHRHATYDAAAACLDEDRAGCAMQGGYSDRRIVRVGPRPHYDHRYDPMDGDDRCRRCGVDHA